jgi:hypothetical protein
MKEEEKKKLKDAFARMKVAEDSLKEASKLLAEFGTDVPSINIDALNMMMKSINSINTSMNFLMSFVRVSTLQQIVPAKTTIKSSQK